MMLLRDHWRLCAELALLLALTGTSWAAFHREPPPAVHEVADEHKAAAKQADTEQHADVGGWTATTYYFAPDKATPPVMAGGVGPGPIPASPGAAVSTPSLVEMVVERHDPTVIESHSHEVASATSDRHLDLTITPQPAPGWAVQVGVEGLQARTLRVAARRRLFGPLWVELSAVPVQRSLGVAAAVEW